MQQAGALQQTASDSSRNFHQTQFFGVSGPVRQRVPAMSPALVKTVTLAIGSAPSPAHTLVDRRSKPEVTRNVLQSQNAGTAILDPTRIGEKLGSRSKHNDIFVCDEESQFYSQCLEKLLVKNSSSNQTVVEFGSGDGSPVISCLMRSQFSGVIHGFELNKEAAHLANCAASEKQVSGRYKIYNSCFFQGMQDIPASCLIANPPYIPAPDNDILMPALHGGEDGANLTRDLMELGFDSAILLISSYANPVDTLQHARQHDYQVTDFMVTPMPFGYYSSEPKVKNWIWKMKAEGKAFCSDSWYLLAGVLLQKRHQNLPSKRRRLHLLDAQIDGTSLGTSLGTSALAANLEPSLDGVHKSGQSDGHVASAKGHAPGLAPPDGVKLDGAALGDCSGLKHRYATTADGAVNNAEDQLEELLKVMTALS